MITTGGKEEFLIGLWFIETMGGGANGMNDRPKEPHEQIKQY